MFSLFNGIVRPYASIPVFWRYWMYYVNPSTYWINGVLAAVLSKQPVRCAPGEAALFNPPPGQTCGQYAGNFVESVGHGYLTNPSATSRCGYCQYASGPEYLATLHIRPDEKWRVCLKLCLYDQLRATDWSLLGFWHLFGFLLHELAPGEYIQ